MLTDAPRGANGRHAPAADSGAERWPLAVMLGLSALMAGALWRISGPPSISVPDLPALRSALAGTELADRDIITVATTLAWLILGYLGFTMTLRCLALAADRATQGARWARVALRLSHLITVPAVRRIVDGGVAGTLLVSSWMPVSARAALAVDPAPVIAMRDLPVAQVEAGATAERDEQVQATQFVAYTVQRGEDLWEIARRFYGDGTRYIDVFEANRDREMPGGERLTDPRLVRSGWVLHLPLPAERFEIEGGTITYEVVRGDHLWGISSRLLGDGFRWVEIWEANRHREMPGRPFSDPNLIYPGWKLVLPGDLVIENATPPAEPVTSVTPTPATPPPTPAEPPASPGAASPAPMEEGGAAESDGDGVSWDWPSVPRPLLVTVAGFAVLGSAVVFVQRLHRAGRLQWPRLVERSIRRNGDAGRVVLTTRAVATALRDAGPTGARIVRVHESPGDLIVALECLAGDAELIASHSDTLASRLSCEITAQILGATRVELRLTNAGKAAMALGDRADTGAALPVPVGADDGGAVVYLDLAGAGSVAVGGSDAERRQLLHDWLAMLSATAGADELAFRADALAAQLLGSDLSLPHFGGAEPDSAPEELVEEIEDLIQSRAGSGRRRPVIVLLDASAPSALAATDRLLRDGPAAGVFVVGLSGGDGGADVDAAFGARVSTNVDTTTDSDAELTGIERRVTLEMATGERLSLDPVLVRRDTSRRWLEGATEPALPGPVPAPPPRDVRDAPTSVVGRKAFDWHRALFEDEEAYEGADAPVAAGADRSPAERASATSDEDEVADDTPMPVPVVAQVIDRQETAESSDEDRNTVAGPAVDPAGDPLLGLAEDADWLADSGHIDREEPVAEHADPAIAAREIGEAASPTDEHTTEQVAHASDGDGASVEGAAQGFRSVSTTRQETLFTATDIGSNSAGGPTRSGEAPVVVCCLGPLRVTVSGVEVTTWPYDKGRELLALLVAHGGAPMTRQAAAEAMWPEFGWDASVKHMMSNAATALRSVIRTASGRDDLQPVTLAQGRYVLQVGIVRSDLDAFEAALRRAVSLPVGEALDEYDRALALYRGDFLESEPFTWADDYQREYRRRFMEGACRAGTLAFEAGLFDRAVRFYEAAVERAPSDEEAARGLMRSLAAGGDPNGARKVYRTLAAALQEELDAPRAAPSAQTQALLAELTEEAAVG